jgi:ubiquinol-cytochrome c reductase cytochrome b subunit
MSYWGAQVIISLFGAIPIWGEEIVTWIRGDYLITGITLNRFFALHVVALPIVLLALVVLHILALHEVGSNNPDGIEIKNNKGPDGKQLDGVPFHPYYTVHDLQAIGVFLFAFAFIMFFMPEMGGYFLEYANFEEANALKTPDHIAPVWYFTPFYSVLRAIPDKFWGFVAFAISVVIPFLLPWLDRSPVRSWRYRGTYTKVALVVFTSSFIILGVLGVKSPTAARTVLTQICTVIYFAFFLLMPVWSSMDKTLPEPKRVTMNGGVGAIGSLVGLALILALAFIPLKVVGAETEFACGAIPCDEVEFDIGDKASLQNGAQVYTDYCMGCHSMKYMRYNRVAQDIGIPEDMLHGTLIHDPEVKVASLMDNAMDQDRAKVWFGAPPPDLTLITRARQPEWVYTYLRNFYRDETRPYGVNNRVFANVGMPHTLLSLQGMQECVPAEGDEAHGHCDELRLVEQGSMDPETFDKTVYDLVNFLNYAAEPMQVDRKRIGRNVLMFILVFFVFAFLLNREYWKDVH